MNQFTVTPLGGLDPVGAVSALKQRNSAEDAQRLQMEQEENRKQAFSQALDGTPESMKKLAEADPRLFMFMEDRNNKRAQAEGAARNEIKNQREQNWFLRYDQALSSNDTEAQKALILEAEEDDNNDLEHGNIGQNPEMDKVITKAALFKSLGEKGYANLYGESNGLEKGVFSVTQTPTGFLKLNNKTGEVSEISSRSKEAEQVRKTEKAKLDQELKLSNTTFERANKIRSRYDKKSGDFVKVRDAFARIQASSTDPDPAGDLSLIFNYMKMLDPGSTVREGEFATAEGAASVPERFKGAYNKVISGEKLTNKQRTAFVNRAKMLMKKADSQQSKDKQESLNIGKQWGVSENDIFGIKQEVQPKESKAVNWSDL